VAQSSKRARELARARYERQQERRAQRAAKRRQRNAVIAVVASVLVVVLAVWGVAALVRGRSSTEASPAAGSTPTTTGAASGASGAAFSCPSPAAVTPTPQTFKSEPPITIDRAASYQATIKTNCGPVVVDLYADKAPHAVNSFIFLAKKGFFSDTLCHRVTTIADGLYVLQCGDPTGTGTGGPGYSYGVENAPKDARYPAGTLALARTSDPNSNGSQFFITYEDSSIPTPGGYTVFGKVVQGLDIVQKIGKAGPGAGSRPKIPVQIQSVEVRKLPKGASS
jgi:peptidyl-prolyl cis-trans isomerase B (cyclophilin B)